MLTPVVVMGVVGLFLLRRRGHRAEAWTLGAVAIAYFVYNIGYWQPFGGGTPGPRFLMPALPFVAVGFASAYRRFPATTLALAVPSGLWMLAASITYPLLGDQGTTAWVSDLGSGTLEHTLLTVLGLHPAWYAIIPVLLAVGAAVAFAVAATPRATQPHPRDFALALGSLGAWVVVSTFGPSITDDAVTPLGSGWRSLIIVGIGLAAALAVVAALWLRRPGPEPVPGPVGSRLALSDPSS